MTLGLAQKLTLLLLCITRTAFRKLKSFPVCVEPHRDDETITGQEGVQAFLNRSLFHTCGGGGPCILIRGGRAKENHKPGSVLKCDAERCKCRVAKLHSLLASASSSPLPRHTAATPSCSLQRDSQTPRLFEASSSPVSSSLQTTVCRIVTISHGNCGGNARSAHSD